MKAWVFLITLTTIVLFKHGRGTSCQSNSAWLQTPRSNDVKSEGVRTEGVLLFIRRAVWENIFFKCYKFLDELLIKVWLILCSTEKVGKLLCSSIWPKTLKKQLFPQHVTFYKNFAKERLDLLVFIFAEDLVNQTFQSFVFPFLMNTRW